MILHRRIPHQPPPIEAKRHQTPIPCELEGSDDREAPVVNLHAHVPNVVELPLILVIHVKIHLVLVLYHLLRAELKNNQICENVVVLSGNCYESVVRADADAGDGLSDRDADVHLADEPRPLGGVDFVVVELHVVTGGQNTVFLESAEIIDQGTVELFEIALAAEGLEGDVE